jgi:hypothetical protein
MRVCQGDNDPKKWLQRHRFRCAGTFAFFCNRECRAVFLCGQRAQTLARFPTLLRSVNVTSSLTRPALYVRAAIAWAGSPTVDPKLSQRQNESESVVYGHIMFEWKGVVMTGEEKGEKAVTQSRSPVDARAGIAVRARGDRARPARSSERGEEAAMSTSPNIVVGEQWLCFLLGFICMVCGVWGICMKYSQGLSSGYVPWLGSAYGPALRLTALACIAFGAVLVHRGLARPDLSSVSGSQKVSPSAGRNRACDAKVPPARRTILGFGWKRKGRN